MLCAVLGMFASPRSMSEKMTIAKNALQSLVQTGTRAGKQELKTLKENEALTIVGYTQRGFVVIANDDKFHAVIGNSDQPFQESNPGLNWWMNAVNEVMSAAQYANADGVNEESRKPIPQLLASEWGQDAPYNNLCPKGDRGRCPSGCVTTAMAQVLYYHKYPLAELIFKEFYV